MTRTRIFAFGSNGSGQLGIGHLQDVSTPEECHFTFDYEDHDHRGLTDRKESHNLKVKCIVAGGNHTVILFENGAVYAAGSNENGKCGQFTTIPAPTTPTLAEGDDGEKSNSNNNMAMSTLKSRPSASPLLRFHRIVFRFGDGKHGKVIDRFTAVSAAWDSTILVASSSSSSSSSTHCNMDVEDRDDLYILGTGPKGELGLGESHTDTSTGPLKMQGFPLLGQRMVSISSGISHTAAVLSDGSVYGWGASRKGQLGDGATKNKHVWTPQRIEDIDFYASYVTCGREFTIVIGLRDGKSAYKILGMDRWDLISGAPRTININGSRIASSWHGIYIHEENQSITAWGRNDRGQLPPLNLPPILRIAPGSEHIVILTVDQKVAAFGWGEHGNCGPQVDAQGNVRGTWNEIPLRLDFLNHIADVGAGCATSFIIASNKEEE
jgi:protein ATS1